MKYSFVESDDQLHEICQELMSERIIGVDLEADSMHCFKEKICLIQIAGKNQAYLVDPFEVKDISSFIQVLENKEIIKVFHGSDFDIRSLDRDYNARVNNLFDTEIACRFLGVKERGLGALLKAHFDVNTDKRFQRVDWSRRPLKQEMIEYSVLDVAHLAQLYDILKIKLEKIGRFDWATEEFGIQEQVRYEHNYNLPLFVKFKGAGRLDNRSLAVLENLLQLRLEIAEKKDRPLFKVFSNKSLMEMAQQKPITVEKMVKNKLLSSRQAEMYGKQCQKAVDTAIKLAHKDLPSYPRSGRRKKDPGVLKRIKELKKMREKLSQNLVLEPGILLNNNLITAIAVENPDSLSKLGDIENIRNWQVGAIGEKIMTCLGHG